VEKVDLAAVVSQDDLAHGSADRSAGGPGGTVENSIDAWGGLRTASYSPPGSLGAALSAWVMSQSPWVHSGPCGLGEEPRGMAVAKSLTVNAGEQSGREKQPR
jgi:hypothetical protein